MSISNSLDSRRITLVVTESGKMNHGDRKINNLHAEDKDIENPGNSSENPTSTEISLSKRKRLFMYALIVALLIVGAWLNAVFLIQNQEARKGINYGVHTPHIEGFLDMIFFHS